MESEGRRIHAQVEIARESGEFLKALEYSDQAILQYQKDKDLLGLAEVLASRQSTFKQLYRQSGDVVFLTLEKFSALAAVAVAEQSGIPEALGIPYHNLGKFYQESKEYEKAAEYFSKSVANLRAYPENRHVRPSVIADIEGHQFAAEYHTGDKSALTRAEKALDDLIQANEENRYNRDVWVSGAHLRIAEMLKEDDIDKAKQHLEMAQNIIDANPDLTLRKEQIERLKTSLFR